MSLPFFKILGKSNFWIKLTSWEYWPFEVIYVPIFFYWLWLALRARSFFFFSSSNPGIENGGMLGESKFDIHQKLPSEIVPITIPIPSDKNEQFVQSEMTSHSLSFPVILKPDIGERGWRVEKIQNAQELGMYMASNRVNILLQEYIEMPVELGIFYFRYPGKRRGQITSIVRKKMLSVVGDGIHSVAELMEQEPRAKLQLATFAKYYADVLHSVPEKDKEVELMPIGNHCRGTTFLDYNKLINRKLVKIFDDLSTRIAGFYFGRFDLRCESIEALYVGKFTIIELNGAGSEPGHIYQPGVSLWKAYKSLFFHWRVLFGISRANKKNGIPYLTTRQGLAVIRRLRAYGRLKAAMA